MGALGGLWPKVALVVLGLITQIAMVSPGSAQTGDTEPTEFLLGTGSTDGTYHPIGVALSTLVKLKLLPSLNVDLTAVNTNGSQDNIERMRQGDLQLAIVSALAGYEGKEGIGRFADLGPNQDLKVIMALWHGVDHVIVRKEAVQTGTIGDVADLRGRPMALGRSNSGTLQGNRALMAPLGLTIDADFDLIELGFDDSVDAFLNGDIAGMAMSGGLPITAVQQTFEALGDEVTILELSDEQLSLIDQGRRIWSRAVIPAGTYQDQDRDIYTAATPHMLVVDADLDENVVYEITKGIFENLNYLQSLHPLTREISLDTAVRNLPLALHQGARRYFDEQGVELPRPPVGMDPNLLARFDSAEDAREEVNQPTVSIFTGMTSDTQTRMAAELATTVSAVDDGMRLLPTFGGGTGQNLTDLIYLKNVDSVHMRADVLAYALENDIYPFIEDQITYITETHPEEVHLVVAEGISDLWQLAEKKVDIGIPGGGDDITAMTILSKLNVPVEATRFGAPLALDKMKKGELAGAFIVGGKPMSLLKEIERDEGLSLLPIPFVQYQDSYVPTVIRPADYPNLVSADRLAADSSGGISTLAVRTALTTYAWREGTSRYRTLANFSTVLFDHLLELQQDGHHAKWREVDPTAEFVRLQRFGPAADWVENNLETAMRIAREGRERLEQSSLDLPAVGLEEEVELPSPVVEQIPAASEPSPPAPAPAPAIAAPILPEPAERDEAESGGVSSSMIPSAEAASAIGRRSVSGGSSPVTSDASRSSSSGNLNPSPASAASNSPTF